MHPLRHDFGSFAVIAPVLRQSPEAGSYSAAAAQYFSASPSLAYRFLGQSIRERVGRKSGHPGRSDSGHSRRFDCVPPTSALPRQRTSIDRRGFGLDATDLRDQPLTGHVADVTKSTRMARVGPSRMSAFAPDALTDALAEEPVSQTRACAEILGGDD